MIRTLALLAGMALAGMAHAQLNCWTGADGKRACGDNPPPGAKMVSKGPAAPAASPAPAAAAKGASSVKGGKGKKNPQNKAD